MSKQLLGAWLKFARGCFYLDTLREQIRATVPETYDVPVEFKIERETTLQTTASFRVGQLPNVADPRFGLLLGDIAGNFRAALDHVAWAMVKTVGRKRLAPAQARRVAFPMATSGKNFDKRVNEYLPGVPLNPYRKLVRSFQPYGRSDGAKGMRLLRTLSDTDKHRIVLPTFWTHSAIHLKVEVSGYRPFKMTEYVTRPRHIKSGATLLRLWMVNLNLPKPLTWAKVKPDSNMSLYPALSGRQPMFDSLNLMGEAVEHILRRFDSLI